MFRCEETGRAEEAAAMATCRVAHARCASTVSHSGTSAVKEASHSTNTPLRDVVNPYFVVIIIITIFLWI